MTNFVLSTILVLIGHGIVFFVAKRKQDELDKRVEKESKRFLDSSRNT
jgi:hypothetical protein